MPSGSHGGSHGSHHSGGSSHSSSHHSGGGSRGVLRGPSMIFIGHGRRVAVPARFSWISTLIGVFAVFIMFGLFFSIPLTIVFNDQLDKIKTDYLYYQNMISYAEEEYAKGNENFIQDGYITDAFYNEDAHRWYYTYAIPYGNGQILEGYTFSVYTFEEIIKFHINDPIKIAVNSYPVTSLTDSIPMDYKDIPLSNDGEYLESVTMRNVSAIVLSVSCGLIVANILLYVAMAVKTKKDIDSKTNHPDLVSVSPAPLNTQSVPTQQTRSAVPQATPIIEEYVRCPRCGGDVTGQKHCSVCGEKLVKR